MNNFWARTITGLSMVFILLAAIFFSGWFFAVIFFIITVLTLWEFFTLVDRDEISPQKWFGTIAGALIYLIMMFTPLLPTDFPRGGWVPFLPFILPVPFLFLSFIFEIYRKSGRPFTNIAMTLAGIIYISVPFSLLLTFARPEVMHKWGLPVVLVGYFAFTWIYDTGAYLYGKQFGRHKFFERISPKKTWEGTIAGAIITLLFATLFSLIVNELPYYDWYLLALMVIFFGTHGDLAESMLKRSLGIKDSGKILPGHGGLLDRFDTMLISAPFVFLYFFLRNLI
jgi:phosphatidate cytidylyltransferase